MVKKKKVTGMGTEKFYESRRVWAAALTLLATIAVVLMPEQYELVISVGTLAATALGLTSWIKPKA
jgi:hypothetical protein